MAKVAEDAAAELPLNDERLPEKVSRHVTIAINHMTQQRNKLNTKIHNLTKERDAIESAIKALDK